MAARHRTLARMVGVKRETQLARLGEPFDVLVVGGGATGLGAAVDAVTRGYRTALIEAEDFAKATSSRSTKLVHGGVRYLQQGNVALVREALHERATMRAIAPHLVHDLEHVVPAYAWHELPYYGAGLTLYDLLSGRRSFGRSRLVPPQSALRRVPGLRRQGLRGAIVYHDGQFDDARYALALARTAVDHGAAVANYVEAIRFTYDSSGRADGAVVREAESGNEFAVRARAIVNATGIFVDRVRRLDDPQAKPMLTLSRGTHVVVRGATLGGSSAILVPRTSDGRVIFALPWHEHTVIGTTDVEQTTVDLDPTPTEDEIAFILREIGTYLEHPLKRSDVLASFAGLRPLVRADATSTSGLSREHVIDVARSGIVTITGGKWTTYRKMAQDAIDAAAQTAALRARPSVTATTPLHGATAAYPSAEWLTVYGTDATAIRAIERDEPALAAPIHPRLPYTGAAVAYAVREEMARTIDDILARRTRALFLNATATSEAVQTVASILAKELGHSNDWVRSSVALFEEVTRHGFPLAASA